jgi:hypothetical protein
MSKAKMQQTETAASPDSKFRGRPQLQRSCKTWLPVTKITAAYAGTVEQSKDWAPVQRIIIAWSAALPDTCLRPWLTVERIIKSAQASQTLDQRELGNLFRESNRLLWPLEDPFATNFGLHRWLRGNREEVYSDWLAWIVEEFDNAAEVFRLLDLQVPPQAARWKNTTAQREAPIPDGRLDIILRWPDTALLVIEVKVTDEESASTAKQNGYKKWMDKQREPHKQAVLLVINAEPGISKGGFTRRDWRGVCLRLRCIATRKLITKIGTQSRTHQGHVVRSALMLGFAGAVEQNLLDMPGSPLQLMNEGYLLNAFPVQKYLKEFHRSAHR